METGRVAETYDTELQRAFASDEAFRRWYERSLPRVFAYVVSRTGGDRDLAEDLTAETFEAAVRERHRFDGRSDSVTWLCAIARHKLVDHVRRREREGRRFAALRLKALVADPEGATWRAADERELVVAVLRDLPSTQRLALVLQALDGLSVREIAHLLGRSEGATQSLITRARESFRRAYSSEAAS